MNLLALLLALGAALSWAGDQVIGKLALRTTSVSVFNAIRPSFTLPLVILFALSTGGLSYPGIELTLITILTGVINWVVAGELYFYAIHRGDAHRIIPIGNSHAIWGVAAAVLLLGEEMRPVLFLSAGLVFTGAYLLTSRVGKTSRWRAGIPLALLAAFMWGSMIVPLKYCLDNGMSVGTLLVIYTASAAVACSIVAGIRHLMTGVRYDRRGVKLSLLSAALGFFIGEILFVSALEMEKASVLAPVPGAVIPFGFLLSILLLGERPTKRAILGMIVVLVGISLVTM